MLSIFLNVEFEAQHAKYRLKSKILIPSDSEVQGKQNRGEIQKQAKYQTEGEL